MTIAAGERLADRLATALGLARGHGEIVAVGLGGGRTSALALA